ncbi:translocon-associated protein subunit delta [Euwallacea fornicatus]|uniref:translocon-associated protein subunit delta n=1 Tax=Euwallacea fornicatus TaxID=995702 RepID=UPI00338F44EE
MTQQIILATLLIGVLTGRSTACINPQVTSKSFTTQDATIVAHIGFISEFQVTCSSGAVSSLYAELQDHSIVPVAVVGDNIFQVSWTEDSKTAKKGQYNIRIFDEEGYAAIRKALRASEPISSVPEFFTVTINHSGAYNGPWLRSEFVAVIISLLVSYFAISTKAKIVS